MITSNKKQPVTTKANICYQTGLSATTAQKNVSTAHTTSNQQIGKRDTAITEDIKSKKFICILVTITLVTILSLVCLAVLAILYLEVAKLSDSLQQSNQNMYSNIIPKQLNSSTHTILQQLSILQNQLLSDNTVLLQQLSILHGHTEQLLLGQSSSNPAASCAALPPSSHSGYYWVRTSNGSAVSVYCDMTLSCGGVTGGWIKMVMINSDNQCPSGLMERNDSPNIRTCVRNETSAGCSSVELSTANIQYTRVCGRITAYQVGSVDNFESTDINSAYVDGVSLTHGTPRQHIWTFAAVNRGNRTGSCCTSSSRPDSVGNNFFCDTGNLASSNVRNSKFYTSHRLWDGDWCTTDNQCCSKDNPPYFHKTLPQPNTDNIEMRVCRNEAVTDEDIAIESVEIYIQ